MAGLEHHRRAAHAPRFEIDDAAHREWIVVLVVNKGLCAEQAGFLAIGQQKNDTLRRRLPLQVMRDLQPHGEADAIVAKAGAGVHAVIVRRQNESGTIRRSCSEEDVLHESAARRISRHRLAHIVSAKFRRITQRPDFLQQSCACLIQRAGINRVRCAVENAAQAFDGALRVELVRRIGLSHAVEFQRRRAEEEQDEQHSEHAKRPWRGRAGARLRGGVAFQMSPLCRRPALARR